MFLRKFLLAGAIVSFTMAGIDFARAETVQDHYKNVVVKKPYSVQVCSEGNGKSSLENLLEGAIVGGAIGNNVPGEDGGGAMGAIIGGILNSERNSGTRCQTETRYDEEYQNVYSHSTVSFYYNGRQYTLRFRK
jgi:hypothetical protein